MTTLEETDYQKTEGKNEESEDEKKRSEPDEPTPGELDVVTSVFKSFETGIREGTMFAKVSLHSQYPLYPSEHFTQGKFNTVMHTSF